MSHLPARITSRLKVPLIVAPMLRVSGPELVSAVCAAGAIGAFPTANASSAEELGHWLDRIEEAARLHTAACRSTPAPYAANLIMRGPRTVEHLPVLVEHGVEVVITSVGSPAPVVGPLHDIGAIVLSDVATLAHARKAVAAGADGLVLLTAGAGGQTGWMNPLAFTRAVREFFDGPVVLAGGIADGHALRAAVTLGADLGYMGTRFIATPESMATPAYRDMLVTSTLDDVVLTSAFTGLPSSMLAPSIRAAGLDPQALDETVTAATAAELYGGGSDGSHPRRWTDVVSAGHSVSGVDAVRPAREIVVRTLAEYGEGPIAPDEVLDAL
ncbi:NAD(P)H-dependent flavin oxidoreductase [Rhodococcus sp. NPDC059968]|uniref:NAD(P)H-dependent flavin oxidoreductase n=1 Tax=Rhodococcus sp. NPDC059968 TaxID=3347017 RepID=UPI0036734485